MAIQNPHEMDMEKRLLLAMVLSMAVLFLGSYLYQPSTPISPPMETVGNEEPLAAPGEVRPPSEARATETPTTAAQRQIIEIENDQLILRWSNIGGVLVSAQLKEYISVEGSPLEIIPQGLAQPHRQVLEVRVGDEELDRRLAGAIYEIEGMVGAKRRAPVEISFVYRDDELEVRRTIRMPESGYLLEMTTEVRSGNRSIPFSVLVGPCLLYTSPSPRDS